MKADSCTAATYRGCAAGGTELYVELVQSRLCGSCGKQSRKTWSSLRMNRYWKQAADKKAYQYSLLHIGALSTTPLIANDFNLGRPEEKRIRMMNVRRSSKLTLGRYALLLPVLLLITLAFSITVRQPLQAATKALEEVIFNIYHNSQRACYLT